MDEIPYKGFIVGAAPELKDGRPTPISPLIPETEEEKGRYRPALRRRRRRLREAKETGAKR